MSAGPGGGKTTVLMTLFDRLVMQCWSTAPKGLHTCHAHIHQLQWRIEVLRWVKRFRVGYCTTHCHAANRYQLAMNWIQEKCFEKLCCISIGNATMCWARQLINLSFVLLQQMKSLSDNLIQLHRRQFADCFESNQRIVFDEDKSNALINSTIAATKQSLNLIIDELNSLLGIAFPIEALQSSTEIDIYGHGMSSFNITFPVDQTASLGQLFSLLSGPADINTKAVFVGEDY